jgi:hypothetical protein
LQELNIAGAWSNVNVPTYIFYGALDIAMSEEDHKKIAELVNRNCGECATYERIPQMDHSLYWVEKNGGNDRSYKPELATRLIEWMHKTIGK